jgi:hypothetical protein
MTYAATRPDGFTQIEARRATGLTSAAIGVTLWQMTRAGDLHAAHVRGEYKRWFVDPTAAREYGLQGARTVAPVGLPRRRAKTSAQDRPGVPMAQVRPSEQYARRTATERRELPMVLPAGVKVIKGPCCVHDPRYQVMPGAEVPRVFSVVPPGVDPMTGRGWGARA